MAYKSATGVTLKTRNGKDYTDKFPALAKALSAWDAAPCVIDGEAVVFDGGISSFSALQAYLKRGTGEVTFMAFDLLYLGTDTRPLPLRQRKQMLEKLLANAPADVKYSAHTDTPPAQMLAAACAQGLEGVIVKDADAPYVGSRTDNWIKVKCANRQEFVVLGYSIKKKALSSLLLGVMEDGVLRYAGRAGTGFSERESETLLAAFAGHFIKEPAVQVPRRHSETYVWMNPVLVTEVAFASWTSGGLLRQASFKGLREDKAAKEVVREMPQKTPRTAKTRDGTLTLTSPDKEMYAGVSKKDVMAYYRKVAKRMLPYVKERLVSLVRCPDGATGACFYQRHMDDPIAGLSQHTIRESDGDKAEYVAIDDENGILNAVQYNTLEFHTWGAQVDTIEQPDTLVFDLDPDKGLDIQAVRQGVKDLKSILDAIGLTAFLKTSGSKGYHIVVPVTPSADWDRVRAFASQVAQAMEQKWPERYTANMRKVKRKGKIYVDWVRNTRGATSVAPYSLRAREVPGISCPIAWKDLDRIAPQDITIKNIFRRRKDPWADYFTVRQEIK